MKQLFFILSFIAVSLSISAQKTAQSSFADSAKISGDWWLQPVLPSDTVTGHLPNINFNLAQKTFKGFTGCNQMSGSFHMLGAGISFDKDLILTKIACEGFNEKDFVANLLRVNGYMIKDGVLILTIDKTPISKWVRKTGRETVMN